MDQVANKASKLARYSAPDSSGGRTCRHERYGDSDRCAEMVCWNYYMKGDAFWSPPSVYEDIAVRDAILSTRDDELPGMWERADFTGGETDQS